MKGTNLGEFEELVLLAVASMRGDAYSVAVCDQLSADTGRTIKLGIVHSVLNRLEAKGLVESSLGEATRMRGGKRKRLYEITGAGKIAIRKSKELRDEMWSRIPKIIFKEA